MELPSRSFVWRGGPHPCVLPAPARALDRRRLPRRLQLGSHDGAVAHVALRGHGSRAGPLPRRGVAWSRPARNPPAAYGRPDHLRDPRCHRARRPARNAASHGRHRAYRQHWLRLASGGHDPLRRARRRLVRNAVDLTRIPAPCIGLAQPTARRGQPSAGIPPGCRTRLSRSLPRR